MYNFWCWSFHKTLDDSKNPKTAFIIDFSPTSSTSFNYGTSSVASVKFSNRSFETGRQCSIENCRFCSFHRISVSTRILKRDNYTNSTWCSNTSFSKTTGLSSSNKVSIQKLLKCSYPNGWKHVVFDHCMSVLIIQVYKRWFLIWIISILKLFFLGIHKLNFCQQGMNLIFTALAEFAGRSFVLIFDQKSW